MPKRPFYQSAGMNPYRRPCWRWDRANDLLAAGRNYSKKRDDPPVGIAMHFLREIRRCLSDARLRRVKQRFRHVHRAHEIWSSDRQRLELECRILARQTDTAIGLVMDLPSETVQAYRDLFYSIDDRIDAMGYILHRVIGIHPTAPPDPVRLMKANAWVHGPGVIEAWLAYCRGNEAPPDLETAEGRQQAWIEFCLDIHKLPDTSETCQVMLRNAVSQFTNGTKTSRTASAHQTFCRTTDLLTSKIGFPDEELPDFSYAPSAPHEGERRFRQETRQMREAA